MVAVAVGAAIVLVAAAVAVGAVAGRSAADPVADLVFGAAA